MKKIHFGTLYNPDTSLFIEVDVLRSPGKSNFFADGSPIDFKDLPLSGGEIQVTLPKTLISAMNKHLAKIDSKKYARAIFASPAILAASKMQLTLNSGSKRSKAANRSTARVKFLLFDYAMEIVRKQKNQSEFITRAIEIALLNHK